jgi:hypothetical protein
MYPVWSFEFVLDALSQEVRMKRVLFFSLLILGAVFLACQSSTIVTASAAAAPQAADANKITIAYSSNLLGYMEPCG